MRLHERYRPCYQMSDEAGAAIAERPAEDAPVIEQPAAEDEATRPNEQERQPERQPQHGNAGKTPWYMTRISEESSRAREALERASAAERRAREAEELAERLRSNNSGQQQERRDDTPAPRQNQDNDRREEIRREAQQQRFYEDTVEVRNRGMAHFGSAFAESLNVLSALGVSNNDFIGDVLAIDKASAHEILDRLAKDPERAVELSRLNSRQRVAELTKMQIAAQTKPAETTTTTKPAEPQAQNGKGVSKAPTPAPRLQPSASQQKDWRSDEVSDDEFSRGWEENRKQRIGARR